MTAAAVQDFKRYRLSLVQRIPMLLFGLLLLEAATAIGSAIYFLVTQVSWQTRYGDKTTVLLYLKDTWDRLPVHVDNWLHVTWFGTSQVAPEWWVTARHDARHVLIGFIAALLVGAVTIPLKNRKRATVGHMLLSVPLAFFAAMATAAALIAFFIFAAPFMEHVGTTTHNSFVQNLVGKGTLQLTIIGFVSGFVAKTILKPTFDTIQLLSLEGKIAQGDDEQWWWKFVYPPNYRHRYRYLCETGHTVEKHNPVIGFALTFGSPLGVLLLGIGVWLLYFGPASHV